MTAWVGVLYLSRVRLLHLSTGGVTIRQRSLQFPDFKARCFDNVDLVVEIQLVHNCTKVCHNLNSFKFSGGKCKAFPNSAQFKSIIFY